MLNGQGCERTPTYDKSTKTPIPKEARIAQAKRLLKHISLPSEILDSHFDEVQEGDGKGFGPTDYTSYMYLKVPQRQIGKWIALMKTEQNYSPRLMTPNVKYRWWVDAAKYQTLKFYEPQPLSSRNGWVGISEKTGEIWILDFTT
jgi:hypothetical protein